MALLMILLEHKGDEAVQFGTLSSELGCLCRYAYVSLSVCLCFCRFCIVRVHSGRAGSKFHMNFVGFSR